MNEVQKSSREARLASNIYKGSITQKISKTYYTTKETDEGDTDKKVEGLVLSFVLHHVQ